MYKQEYELLKNIDKNKNKLKNKKTNKLLNRIKELERQTQVLKNTINYLLDSM